jgi:hypothetical protein
MRIAWQGLLVKQHLLVIAAICATAVICATLAVNAYADDTQPLPNINMYQGAPVTTPGQNGLQQVTNMAADIADKAAAGEKLVTPGGVLQAGTEAACNLLGNTQITGSQFSPNAKEECELAANLGGVLLACPASPTGIALALCLQSSYNALKNVNELTAYNQCADQGLPASDCGGKDPPNAQAEFMKCLAQGDGEDLTYANIDTAMIGDAFWETCADQYGQDVANSAKDAINSAQQDQASHTPKKDATWPDCQANSGAPTPNQMPTPCMCILYNNDGSTGSINGNYGMENGSTYGTQVRIEGKGSGNPTDSMIPNGCNVPPIKNNSEAEAAKRVSQLTGVPVSKIGKGTENDPAKIMGVPTAPSPIGSGTPLQPTSLGGLLGDE